MEHNTNSSAGAEQLPAAQGYIPQSPVSDSYPGKKRDLGSAFPHLPPDRVSKRSRSHSHSPPRSTTFEYEKNDDTIDNNGVTINGSDTTAIASESCEMKQAQYVLPLDLLQGTSTPGGNTLESNATPNLDGVENLLERSRNEICRQIEIIKQNTTNGRVDIDTAGILVDEISKVAAANNLATPEKIAQMRCIFFPLDNLPIPPVSLESDQTSSRNITSPLSDLNTLSSPAFHISEFSAAVPSTTIGIELQDKATQTEPTPINTHNDTLHDPIHHHGFSDTELWERELELIRRAQPLVVGAYTTVNVPLRETGVKTDHSINPISQSPPRGEIRSSTMTSCNNRRENCDVISLYDTDDENKAMPAYSSQLVGGGDLIYGENGVTVVGTDDEEETSIPGQRSRYESRPNENTVDDLADYEESDIDENTLKEGVRYPHKATVSTERYDGKNTRYAGYNNVKDRTDRKNDCDLNYHDVMNRSRSEKRGRAAYEHTSYGRSNAGRARSRSPEYQRGRSSEEKSYREKRHYVGGYTSNDSPTYLRREKQYDHAEQRYIRDEPEKLCFYGYDASAELTRKDKESLQYQDRFSDVGEIPGPKSGLRLKLDDYIYDIGSAAVGLERDIKRVTQETFYACETLDEEQALQQFWVNQPTRLYKGFPLVEDIGFVAVGNHATPEGDCYWRALAYTLHGKPARWDMIKADHLAYIQHVLSDKTHPRHQLYAKLNARFYETTSGILKSGHMRATKFKANIWQLLHLPHSWTPGVMQQITADLYNIHLVTFTCDRLKKRCSEVSVRGAYNSRHVFMLFTNECHFQPLTVNEYLS